MTTTARPTSADVTQPADDARATARATTRQIAHDTEDLSGLGLELRIALDGEYAEPRARGRGLLTPGELVRPVGQTMSEAREWTIATLRGLTARNIANGMQVGDGTADGASSVLAFELMSGGDLSLTIKAGVQFGLFGGAIANLGTEYHHTTWLPQAISLDLPGCYAMTEYGHGSDVQNLETTITWSEGEFEVHTPTDSAVKTYIGNAARDGRMAVVFGQLIVGEERHGIHAILVPIRSANGETLPGVTLGDNGPKGGLPGVDNGTLSFDHVRVPREMLLDRYGGVSEDGLYHSDIESQGRRFFTMLGTLVRGRICVGVGGAIAARRALSIATRYATIRRQFTAPGRPDGVILLDYLAHQRRLLPLIAQAYALGFAHNDITAAFDDVVRASVRDVAQARELELRAAGLKVAQTAFALRASQEAREACGGAGFMSENGITQIRADVDVFATFEGDNTVLSQLVAKGLLGEYADQWKSLDLLGTVTATTAMIGRSVFEHAPGRRLIEGLVAAAKRKDTGVYSQGWQAWMFEERERHVIESLAARMRRAMKLTGEEAFAEVNRAQDHMLYAARVHTDSRILDAFIVGIAECADPEARAVLEDLCDLYALSVLADDAGWFLEHNRMSAARSKEVRRAVNALCGKLRPHALALVEGLGVPAGALGSAMLA